MTYSSDREAKEQLWRASNARALGGEFDNCENIRRIVDLRRQIAGLLGYETYADYVLEERMAENTATVNAFLQELLDETIDYARADYAMINDYAHAQGFEGDVMPWDWSYYAEKYKNEKYALSDEQVKPYFELEKVKKGGLPAGQQALWAEFRQARRHRRLSSRRDGLRGDRREGRLRSGALPRFLPACVEARRCVDDRVPRFEGGRGRRDAPAGVAGDELHQADRDETFAADLRRGEHLPPRVRPFAARHVGPGRSTSR